MDSQREFEERLFQTDSWRVFRIVSEFVDGFETLTQIGPSVSLFGSSRLPSPTPYYNMAMDVSQKIAQRGFAIITGGGPGLMEAANKGARSVGGISVGVGIDVEHEREINPFVDPQYCLRFRYFFVRKVMFIRYAIGCVFLPGGYGTLDELFEVLTLIQTKKIRPFPIFLMGISYWKGLFEWVQETMIHTGCISQEDLKLIHFTDDPEEVANGIEENYTKEQPLKNF